MTDYNDMTMGDVAKRLAKSLLVDLVGAIEGGEATSQDRAVARDVCDRLGVLNLADSDQLAELRKMAKENQIQKSKVPTAEPDDDDKG